jgi:hypothetical protein
MPTNLAKGMMISAIIALCAILLWFGAPMLFIGIDQGSFPLLIGGILSIIVQIAAILYLIDFCLL